MNCIHLIVAMFSASHMQPGPAALSVTLSVENTFPAQVKAMGLEVVESSAGTFILGTDNTDDVIYWYSPWGAVTDTTQLDPLNGHCFGVVYDQMEGVFHTNDWEETDLFFSEDSGATWNRVMDPSLNQGRGIDFDGTAYWTTNGNSGILLFTPGNPPTGSFPLPEIYSQLSGLAVFPADGGTGVAVTTYADLNIWFYLWNGTDLSFIGSAPCPAECQSSYGLAYSESRGTIFWSYRTASNQFFISELAFDTGLVLQQNTWAGIKSSF